MKKAKNEGVFVEFSECGTCNFHTDLFCVYCEVWCCRVHMNCCIQCEQPVCNVCYLNDRCCLVRPWGEKEELHLKKFYQGKKFEPGSDLLTIIRPGRRTVRQQIKEGRSIRRDFVLRESLSMIEGFDSKFFKSWFSMLLIGDESLLKDCFKDVSRFLENEETCKKFIKFLKSAKSGLCYVLLYCNQRSEIISLMMDYIRESELEGQLTSTALANEEGLSLFRCLKEKGMLDRHSAMSLRSNHLEGLLWMEEVLGIDLCAVNRKGFFIHINVGSVDIVEYLLTKKGMSVAFLFKNSHIRSLEILKMIHRVKGKRKS